MPSLYNFLYYFQKKILDSYVLYKIITKFTAPKPTTYNKIKSMSKYIRTLTITYDLPITHREIPLFRGAVLKSLGDRANLLYHNHTGADTFRYAYPLIQYKRLHGKAAIVCIEEGVDLVGQILSEISGTLMIGKREVKCRIDQVHTTEVPIHITDVPVYYHLYQWLPLNSKNYEEYQNTDDLIERIKILERVLTGNLLSFLKGVDIHVEEQLQLHIIDIQKQQIVHYKKLKLMSFDVAIKINLNLPSYIGIGKNASVGFGTLTRITN